MKKKNTKSNLIIFQAKTGAVELKGDFAHETVWATQAQIARIFSVNPQAITKHLKNIYKEGELDKKGTCSKMEQVQNEGGKTVKRNVEIYNLEALIAIGYRINSILGTHFRQWATKTLRDHITKGYTINPKVIKSNYEEFRRAIENVKALLPAGARVDNASILELVSAFADTWLSLDAYDKDELTLSGATRRTVVLTAEKLAKALKEFKASLIEKGEATELFGQEKQKEAVAGIVGNVMQSFGGQAVYPTIEEKAAHLLYFMIKNHPFVDGNKRSGAFAFVWFLQKAKILNRSKLSPVALTALTLLVAESDPKNKDRMVKVVLQMLKK